MAPWDQRVNEMFLTAAEIESDEQRASYLDQACAGDADLRASVETLVNAHAAAGTFLARPVVAGLTRQPDLSLPAGSVIGRYKLLEPIGEGGYGTVFMAEQTSPVQRRVALKIIKAGMDTRQVIARFEAERQALALMDHPNIARVFDAGVTDTGRPYFVMELVKGISVTKYCDEHRLPPRVRLELFMQVCQAVQHAHQKGIIHRDLKPSNVLIAQYDGKPVPKVIDFGVAKAAGQQLTEMTMFTGFGDVIGTPQYMSPEQAELNQLDIDTRSDIYSLGVLLYELLTGTTPLESKRLKKAALLEVLRVIREEEPPKPSTRLSTVAELPSIAAQRGVEPKKLSGLVHGELDWIVMKALEKDRTRRYETANGFALDVQRYLHDEAVLACPPSAAYRFRKFARRHRGAFLAASLSFVVLLLLVAGLAVSNRIIAGERNDKAAAQALAEAQAKRAQHNFWRASIAIRELMTKTALGRDEVPLPVRKRFSDEAIKYYQALLQEGSDDPSLRYETGVGYRTLGMLHGTWQNLDLAEKCYRQSIDILTALSAQHPGEQKYRHQLAYACLEFAGMLRNVKRYPESGTVFDRGAQIYEKLLLESPDSYDYAFELATLERGRFNLHIFTGDVQAAQAAYRRAVELFTRLAEGRTGPDPYPAGQTRARLLTEVTNLHGGWTSLLGSKGRHDDAEAVLRDAIAAFDNAAARDAAAAPAYQVRSAGMQFALGQLYARRVRLDDAAGAYRAAAGRYEAVSAESHSADTLHDWLLCWQSLMDMYRADPQKDLADAEEAYRNVLQILSRAPAELARNRRVRERIGHMQRIRGADLWVAKRHEDAEQSYRDGAATFEQLIVDEPTYGHYLHWAADSHRMVAEVMFSDGRPEQSERELRRSVALYEQRATRFADQPINDHERLAAYSLLARLLIRTGRADEAESLLRATGQPELEAALRTTIGEAYLSLGMTAKAKTHLQTALEFLQQSSGEQSALTARVLVRLAQVSHDEGDNPRAIALAKDALGIHRSLQSVPAARLDALTSLQQHLAYNNPVESEQLGTEALAIARAAGESERGRVPVIMHRLAAAKLHQRQVAEAEKLAREAIELHREVNGADHLQTGWALYLLGQVLDEQGRSSEAQSCFQEALRIIRTNQPANSKAITLILKRLKSPATAPSQEKQKSGR